MALRFHYDPQKARSNLRKHGVSFEEAQTVFQDLLALTVADEAQPEDEQREFTIGYSQRLRLLLVVHTEVNHGEIRIISARKATRTKPDDTLPTEAKRPDFSKGVRGKYFELATQGKQVVVLDDDLRDAFPSSASVNEALRSLLAVAQRASSRRKRAA